MILSTNGGHSARVRMRLMVNGSTFAVAQMGPDFLVLDAPADHDPAPARLKLEVDASVQEWQVDLPQGICAASQRVVIALPR